MQIVMVQPLKKHKMQATGRSAFSLIELAVVLAILGLLAGGILGANSYIESAKRTTLINEGKLLQNAFKQFEQKYAALPGDMADATNHWPQSAACPTTGAAGTVCNGDGNGWAGGNAVAPLYAQEYFYIFRHLQLAGFISGGYTGNNANGVTSAAGAAIPGTNIPALAMEGSGAYFSSPTPEGHVTVAGGYTSYFDGNYGNGTLIIGAHGPGSMPLGGLLFPSEMMELDQKFDDGRADNGWIRSYRSFTDCVSGNQYLGTGNRIGCVVIMLPH